MSPTPRIIREAVGENTADTVEIQDNYAAIFLRGVERIAEFQKHAIDFAVQQNTELVDIWKKATEKVPGGPRLPMLDLASGAVSRYADTQKAAIDFVVEQSHVWTDAFKDRASTLKKSNDSTVNVAKQTMERSFAVHKKALEHTAAQTKAMVDAAKHQFGFTGTQADAMTDTFQKGVDTIVEAQKELLDLVTH